MNDAHDVEKLLDVRGPLNNRFWRVKWAGVDSEGNERLDMVTWVHKRVPLSSSGCRMHNHLSVEFDVECVDLQNQIWKIEKTTRMNLHRSIFFLSRW